MQKTTTETGNGRWNKKAGKLYGDRPLLGNPALWTIYPGFRKSQTVCSFFSKKLQPPCVMPFEKVNARREKRECAFSLTKGRLTWQLTNYLVVLFHGRDSVETVRRILHPGKKRAISKDFSKGSSRNTEKNWKGQEKLSIILYGLKWKVIFESPNYAIKMK